MGNFIKNVEQLLSRNSTVNLSTNVTKISHGIKTRYINDGLTLYIVIGADSVTAAQLNFNPCVDALICENVGQCISITGEVSVLKSSEDIIPIVRKWNEKYRDEQLADDLDGKILIKINPLRIEETDAQSSKSPERLIFPSENGLIKRFFNTLILTIKMWVSILRAPFFTASIAPVLLGASIAYNQHSIFNLQTFLLTLAGTIIAHAAANVINDYYDHRSGNDEMNINHNTFSGGSRMIQNKIISPGYTCFIAVCLFLFTIAIGLYLNSVSRGNTILFIGVAGVLLAFSYSASPLKLSYRTIGEPAIVFSYGPLIVMGTYYVQAQSLDILPLMASIPSGILVGLILFINEFQDMFADGAAGKNTIVVKLKKKSRSLVVYKASIIFVFLWLIGLTTLNIFPAWTLITLAAFPLVLKAFSVASKHYDSINELLPANAMTIMIHLLVTLLFSLAFILDKIL